MLLLLIRNVLTLESLIHDSLQKVSWLIFEGALHKSHLKELNAPMFQSTCGPSRGPSLKVFMGLVFCFTEKCWARPRLDKVLSGQAQNTLCTRHNSDMSDVQVYTQCF